MASVTNQLLIRNIGRGCLVALAIGIASSTVSPTSAWADRAGSGSRDGHSASSKSSTGSTGLRGGRSAGTATKVGEGTRGLAQGPSPDSSLISPSAGPSSAISGIVSYDTTATSRIQEHSSSQASPTAAKKQNIDSLQMLINKIS